MVMVKSIAFKISRQEDKNGLLGLVMEDLVNQRQKGT